MLIKQERERDGDENRRNEDVEVDMWYNLARLDNKCGYKKFVASGADHRQIEMGAIEMV